MTFSRLATRCLPILILSASAHAVSCLEYVRKSGTISVTPVVTEMTTAEVNELVAKIKASGGQAKVASEKPHLSRKDDVIFASFPSLKDDTFQVFGLQGPRGYVRPDLKEIEEFRQGKVEITSITDDVDAGHYDLATKHNLLQTRKRAIVYGPLTSPTVIDMETNEVISALARVGANDRLVITTRIDQKIGFHLRPADAERNYMVEVYLIEPTGHSFLGFRVPAPKDGYPQIHLVDLGKEGALLTIDDQTFRLNLVKTPAATGA